MVRRHEVTIGMIFMNPGNYPKFIAALNSVLKNRYFNIHLVLIDNTGLEYFVHDPNTNDPYVKIRRKDNGEPLFVQFENDLDFEKDCIEFVQNSSPQSVAANWNTIYKKSSSPVVIFLNDDILMNQYFDKILYDAVFTGDCDFTGIVSFPEVYPHPEIVDRGWSYDSAQDLNRRGERIAGFNGACWAARRSLLHEVARIQIQHEPFDTHYKLACYEDLDLYKIVTDCLDCVCEILYSSFIFHYGASTRNSEMVQELQKKHTNGMYHIAFNREVFKKKWNMSDEDLVQFERCLYKGWNDVDKNHSVTKLCPSEHKNHGVTKLCPSEQKKE